MKDMSLNLEYVHIKDVVFGEKTSIEDGILTVNKDELIETVQTDKLINIDVDIAKPGESTRIIPVKDVIEPRIKVETEKAFPGVLDGYSLCGEGTTKVLRGCCVTTCGKIIGFQEGIIDMSGPATKYCRFSQLINIVVVADPAEGLTPAEHETEIRMLGLKASLYLAKASLEVKADEVKTYRREPVDPALKLPKVAYAFLIMAQGLLHDNYVYGLNAIQLNAQLLHPNEIFDGAIVSGNCVTASDKNTTYDIQNHAIVEELYRRHGVDLDFCGLIASPISTILAEKERNAMVTVNLAQTCLADSIIISQEGGGNPEADLMLICERAEERDISSVIVMHDNPGPDGTSEPMANTSPKATAVITTGNDNCIIELPEMEKNIGYREQLHLLSGSPDDCEAGNGKIRVGILVIMGSASNSANGYYCTEPY